MTIDYSFKILETLLMAKSYESRADVISTAEVIVSVVCSFGNLSPAWTSAYKESLKKLKSLNFDEMKEIIGILSSYDDDEESKEIDEEENGMDDEEEIEDYGETEYNMGMNFYSQKEFQQSAACFRTAARKGSGKAEYNYAVCLYNGQGIPMDKVEAIKRFVSASENGIEQADRMLHYIAYGAEQNGGGS